MKSRKELLDYAWLGGKTMPNNEADIHYATLEVLLDIRDLLIMLTKKRSRSAKQTQGK